MASLDGEADRSAKEIEAFAENCGKLQWVNLDGSPETVNVLLSLFALLTRHQPAASGLNNEMQIGDLDSSVPHTRDAVCNVFARMPGAPAHRALCQILKTETNPKYRKWILERKAQHTELEVERFAAREPRQLRELGTAFSSEPKTETQLFQQVMSRLEEIITSIEEGPFSERALFRPKMPEKHLQLWLASRLRDTPNRRFSVHREEEVDDDKKTDIQASCGAGSVCIEIKPVDLWRSYSANSLTDTLRTQLVGQYLKGYNSKHGVLVIIRLDNKLWDIPGEGKAQPFAALVKYLQRQAATIRAESKGVEELVVLGMDCVG